MLDPVKFANAMLDALPHKTDKDGKPIPVTGQLLKRAQGIIASLKAAVVSNAPGTIVGTCAGSLQNGAGTLGVAVVPPAPMIAVQSSITAPLLNAEATAFCLYITTFGKVVFDPGNITGVCPPLGGPLGGGAGVNGKFTAMTGAACAAFVASQIGTGGPDMVKDYDVTLKYIMANAVITYPPGTVQGACPAGGGPLGGGFAAGGTIA